MTGLLVAASAHPTQFSLLCVLPLCPPSCVEMIFFVHWLCASSCVEDWSQYPLWSSFVESENSSCGEGGHVEQVARTSKHILKIEALQCIVFLGTLRGWKRRWRDGVRLIRWYPWGGIQAWDINCYISKQGGDGGLSMENEGHLRADRTKYHRALRDVEVFWKQKARVAWLQGGNQNIRLFSYIYINQKKQEFSRTRRN